jgi:hypothetical protein
MSKWPMRGHFRHLRFKTFSTTPRTLPCKLFWALLSSSKHPGVLEDSKSWTFPNVGLHPHTWPKWGCDSLTEHEQIMQSNAIVWTSCLMHRCVISTMFGSCFSFLKRLLSFLFFIFMCFLFLLLFCIIKIKCLFFTFVFLFIWMQVWSLEKEDTPRSSSRIFLHYYKFYFFLFSTFYLVFFFCNFSLLIFLTVFPFPCFICFHSFSIIFFLLFFVYLCFMF